MRPAYKRIYLSPPHLGDAERAFVEDAFASNWIAPVGPHIEAFEAEFGRYLGVPNAVALSSGTAGIHLSLRLLNLKAGDEVFCSTLTFSASANPIVYEQGRPTFIDCEEESWNMDAALLAEALALRARQGRLPRAVILVHLYGQMANMDAICKSCAQHRVPLIEDAAEALGSTYKGQSAGTFGFTGVFSFNGNKIITASGGGMLVTGSQTVAERVRYLATQAREPAAHYEHSEIGYNYRLSNLMAAVGRGQLLVLEDRVAARRRNFEFYRGALGDLPGIKFMPEATWGRSTRWLTCITIDPRRFGADREHVRLALAAENIEARPIWKPMHMQPVFAGCDFFGNQNAARLFANGLCLPSGSALSHDELSWICQVIRETARR